MEGLTLSGASFGQSSDMEVIFIEFITRVLHIDLVVYNSTRNPFQHVRTFPKEIHTVKMSTRSSRGPPPLKMVVLG